MVCRTDLNEPGESIEHGSGSSKCHTNGVHTEKTRDAKLEISASLKTLENAF